MLFTETTVDNRQTNGTQKMTDIYKDIIVIEVYRKVPQLQRCTTHTVAVTYLYNIHVPQFANDHDIRIRTSTVFQL